MMKEFFIKSLCYFIPFKNLRKKVRNTFLDQNSKNSLSNVFILYKENGEKIFNPNITGLEIIFLGDNNKVEIYSPITFKNCHFKLENNNSITIKQTTGIIENLRAPNGLSDNQTLYIGENFACVGVDIHLHDETHTSVTIGDNCMFSYNVVIWPSDGHTLYDNITKEAINKPKRNIIIGNHVWIGRAVSILKDVSIADDTIIGCCSVVNKPFDENNIVLAGIPAKIVKSNVNWDSKNTEHFEIQRKMEEEKSLYEN